MCLCHRDVSTPGRDVPVQTKGVGVGSLVTSLPLTRRRAWVQIADKMAAEMSNETAAEKTMFLCSSCGFECHYEYFGKKPPFSKSLVYVFYCFFQFYLFTES